MGERVRLASNAPGMTQKAGSWTLEAIGLFLGGFGVLVLFLEPSPRAHAILIAEALVVVGLPSILIYAGYWMGHQEFDSAQRWTVARWSMGGLIVASFFGKWILLRQGTIGGDIVEPIFFLVSVAAFGSVSGLAAGVTHVKYGTAESAAADPSGPTGPDEAPQFDGGSGRSADPARLLGELPEPTFVDLVDVLRDHHRVAVVEYLRRTAEGSATVEELIEHVAEKEERADWPTGALREETVAVSLHHHHLPRLADAGIVSYEEERGIVRLRPSTAAGRPDLDRDGSRRGG